MFKSDISEARILRTALTTYNILLKYRNKQRENEKNWEQQDMDALHEECATLLLNQFMENGGVFIKVGQTIASLNHLLPEPYIRIFQKCQDKVLLHLRKF
jgi:aarF domain-containing kinase